MHCMLSVVHCLRPSRARWSCHARYVLGDEALINATKQDGNTALHLAAQMNLGPMIDVLVSHGANIGAKNHNGITALEIARQGQRHDAYLRLQTHSVAST
eukprot:m.1102801 g.1102801  ORF g.1102801 m.1102801 type:complete len:100 (-) comp24326_c0_seq112:393-692(-)